MTIQEVIDELSKYDSNAVVYLASDETIGYEYEVEYTHFYPNGDKSRVVLG